MTWMERFFKKHGWIWFHGQFPCFAHRWLGRETFSWTSSQRASLGAWSPPPPTKVGSVLLGYGKVNLKVN